MPNFGENTSNPNPLGGDNCVRHRQWDINFQLVDPGGGLPKLLKVVGTGEEHRYCSNNAPPKTRVFVTFPSGPTCNAPLDIIDDFAACPDLDDPEKAGPAVTKMALETLKEYKRKNPNFDICSEGCMAGATLKVDCYTIIGPCNEDDFGADNNCSYLGPIDQSFNLTSQLKLEIGQDPPFGFIPANWCDYPAFDPYDCDYAEFVAREMLFLRIELSIEAILTTLLDDAIFGGNSFQFVDVTGVKSIRFNLRQFKHIHKLITDPRVTGAIRQLELALARAYEKYLECLKDTLN